MNSTNSESIFENVSWEDLPEIRQRMGYQSFYDSLFEYERNKYQSYLNNYQEQHFKSKLMKLLFHWDKSILVKQMIQEVKKYICKQTGIEEIEEKEEKEQKEKEQEEKEQQLDINSCFNIPKEIEINIDDYDTQKELEIKLKEILSKVENDRTNKIYFAYKSIELAIKLINISDNSEKYKQLKLTVLGKINEFIKDPQMDCLKNKLAEFYKKLGGLTETIKSKCADWELTEACLLEFLYFKQTPSFIVTNLLDTDPEDYHDVLTLNGEKYKYTYFIWRREGDPNLIRAREDEIITRENFKKYSRFQTVGWSVKQLRTFFNINILPIILQKSNININVNLPNYKEIIDNVLFKSKLNKLIDEYITTNTIAINTNNLSEIKEKINASLNNLKDLSPYSITRYMDDNIFYFFIAQLMKQQAIVQKSLQEKIQNIQTKIENKTGTGSKYKWQRMCAKLGNLEIEQLRELAVIENISNYQMKSKRELCKEFEEILQRKINEQRRQMIQYIPEPEKPRDTKNKKLNEQLNKLFTRHIQNNLTDSEKKHKQRYPKQYSQKCQNSDSLTGDDLTDIKPEFFFTYKHNNKIFCEDIRILYDQIQRGIDENPYDRTPLSPELIETIKKTYKKLKATMLSLKDTQVEEEAIPLESVLTSKTADLLGLLFHHAPIENFLHCDQNIFREFVMYLEDEHILSNREAEHIISLRDLQAQKIGLVDLLTMKIRNDPNVVDGFSSMASNITDVYNRVFTDELASDQESSEQESINEPLQNESDNIIIQRKAMIFFSKLQNVPGINHLNIVRTGSAKISDLIRYLIDANVFEIRLLDEWTRTGLLSREGVPIEANLVKLKIEVLQKLINIIQDTPDAAETISNIVRTHDIFN